MSDFSIVIPTFNSGKRWADCLIAIRRQVVQPISIIIIDSSSNDNTIEIAKQFDCQIIDISKEQFGHGKTRQQALSYIKDCQFVVFLTQDAILANSDSLQNILRVFNHNSVGAAFGRQLANNDANSIEVHAREFNYPEHSQIKKLANATHYGIKVTFLSNSFAAYRIKTLNEIGGFPQDVIMSEDTYVGAKMLLAGYHIAYCGDATVYHSHNYSLRELFQRYFDIGVFNGREKWIQERFGKAEKEGGRYLKSQVRYLWKNAPLALPLAFLQTAAKWLGYKLGYNERLLPNTIKRYLSMHSAFWIADKEDK